VLVVWPSRFFWAKMFKKAHRLKACAPFQVTVDYSMTAQLRYCFAQRGYIDMPDAW
jgi:hypothetical protein